ncbi:NAD(P)H-dependent glycerol-3-phosphate dehydrogenase [Solirhodobacter olei]|uniref:NAD(P)H-dependent glycerol-3-phosphate dehydrogenase n=1 Tax=Solirhodobacter olei TaxID=2493082 RepID=UPI000FDA7A7D|nr:NAD(P)H-dependent glycerol-3-phosphate dehydrogenase [Solirhodobacter olei]
MSLAVAGSGAFGTALAVALGRTGAAVTLWSRDPDQARVMVETGRNDRRLPGVDLPDTVTPTGDAGALATSKTVLLAMPMQSLAGFLDAHGSTLDGRALVACCKGIDLTRLEGASALIARACPAAVPAVLTGPSFAADIAKGLPTALTLACADEAAGARLQAQLSTPILRLYRSPDVIGAELGGALKNVIAIAAGVVIGARLGESARAALITRGFAEMQRLALRLGARTETLAGLSGFGDLVLTCTSEQSRNFRFGIALGQGTAFDTSVTVEGAATARAATALAQSLSIDMPITGMVAALLDQRIGIRAAVEALMSRPLKQE